MNLILKKFIKDPKNIGAITPSSNRSAKKIAELVNLKSTKNIIEIGGGTGALSQYIKNKNLTIIERDKDLYEVLKRKYQNHNIVHNCGLEYLKKNVREEYGLVISIPMIKSDVKLNLINMINQHLSENKIQWFIILGYRYFNQFEQLGFKNKERHLVINNIPPAFIWHYF